MEKDKEFQWVSDSNKTDKYQGVAAPKEETNIDDNPATYTHFDMLAMVARQTKHMFEENTALREALKELLPIAQWGYDLLVPFDKKGMGRECPAIIERARKLIDKT